MNFFSGLFYKLITLIGRFVVLMVFIDTWTRGYLKLLMKKFAH